MAGNFTRKCPPPRPRGGTTVKLDKSDWLVEIISTGEVLIIDDCTYLELCNELDQKHPNDWELWDRD